MGASLSEYSSMLYVVVHGLVHFIGQQQDAERVGIYNRKGYKHSITVRLHVDYTTY